MEFFRPRALIRPLPLFVATLAWQARKLESLHGKQTPPELKASSPPNPSPAQGKHVFGRDGEVWRSKTCTLCPSRVRRRWRSAICWVSRRRSASDTGPRRRLHEGLGQGRTRIPTLTSSDPLSILGVGHATCTPEASGLSQLGSALPRRKPHDWPSLLHMAAKLLICPTSTSKSFTLLRSL